MTKAPARMPIVTHLRASLIRIFIAGPGKSASSDFEADLREEGVLDETLGIAEPAIELSVLNARCELLVDFHRNADIQGRTDQKLRILRPIDIDHASPWGKVEAIIPTFEDGFDVAAESYDRRHSFLFVLRKYPKIAAIGIRGRFVNVQVRPEHYATGIEAAEKREASRFRDVVPC